VDVIVLLWVMGLGWFVIVVVRFVLPLLGVVTAL